MGTLIISIKLLLSSFITINVLPDKRVLSLVTKKLAGRERERKYKN
jgi:hypothetical protein